MAKYKTRLVELQFKDGFTGFEDGLTLELVSNLWLKMPKASSTHGSTKNIAVEISNWCYWMPVWWTKLCFKDRNFTLSLGSAGLLIQKRSQCVFHPKRTEDFTTCWVFGRFFWENRSRPGRQKSIPQDDQDGNPQNGEFTISKCPWLVLLIYQPPIYCERFSQQTHQGVWWLWCSRFGSKISDLFIDALQCGFRISDLRPSGALEEGLPQEIRHTVWLSDLSAHAKSRAWLCSSKRWSLSKSPKYDDCVQRHHNLMVNSKWIPNRSTLRSALVLVKPIKQITQITC